jgi:integrase
MKGLYQVNGTWYMCYVDPTGKYVRKSAGTKSKTEAGAILQAIKTDIRRGQYSFTSKKIIKFEELAEKYINDYSKGEGEKKSWKRDEVSIKKLKEYFSGMDISKISKKDVIDYKIKRREHYKKGSKTKISPKTVNRELACIRHMFNKAIDWGLIKVNPIARIKLYKEEKRERVILTREEADLLINLAEEPAKTAIMITLNTGARTSEALSLKWADIDFEKNDIRIREQKTEERHVPLSRELKEHLFYKDQLSDWIIYNKQSGTHYKYIRKPFNEARDKVVQKLADRTRIDKVKKLTFYDLRHTFGTWLGETKTSPFVIMELMGHKNIETTKLYVQPREEAKRAAVELLSIRDKDKKNVTLVSHPGDLVQ